MKVNTGVTTLTRLMKGTMAELGTAQAQITSGLQNPDPATDPLASTISKRISQDAETSSGVRDVVKQGQNTVEVSWGIVQSNISLLQGMRELALQAVNGSYKDVSDRVHMDNVFQSHISQIDSNANTKWGSRTMFDGTFFMSCQTDLQAVNASVTSAATNILGATDLTLNGTPVGAVASGSAKDIALAINAISGSTYVSASATTAISGAGVFNAVAVGNAKIVINGTQVTIGALTGTESADQTIDKTVSAINGDGTLAGLGISASNAGGYLKITASDGSDLSIAYMGGIGADNVAGPAAGIYHGAVALASMYKIDIGGVAPANAGLTAGATFPNGITTVTLGDLTAAALFGDTLPNVTTQDNAQLAIDAIDAAMSTIIDESSRLMMYSSDFERISNNMETLNVNLQTVLSEYNDADFAAAVSDSQRLSVLRDAGMATLKNEFADYGRLGQLVGEVLRR
jgi:flagellin